MTTDRPDTTESPFTVDAGRVQVETNLLGFSRSRPDADGVVTDTYEFATTNIRIGLTAMPRSTSSGSRMAWPARGTPIPSRTSAIRRWRRGPTRQVQSLGQRQVRQAGLDRAGLAAVRHAPDQQEQWHQSGARGGRADRAVRHQPAQQFRPRPECRHGVPERTTARQAITRSISPRRPCRTRGTTRSARTTRWPPSSAEPAVTSSFSVQASRTSLARTSSLMPA